NVHSASSGAARYQRSASTRASSSSPARKVSAYEARAEAGSASRLAKSASGLSRDSNGEEARLVGAGSGARDTSQVREGWIRCTLSSSCWATSAGTGAPSSMDAAKALRSSPHPDQKSSMATADSSERRRRNRAIP